MTPRRRLYRRPRWTRSSHGPPGRRAVRCIMDSSITLAAGGSEAATESSRTSRRAASAPQVQPLRPKPELASSAVANDLVARLSAYQQPVASPRDNAALIRNAYAVAREAHE